MGFNLSKPSKMLKSTGNDGDKTYIVHQQRNDQDIKVVLHKDNSVDVYDIYGRMLEGPDKNVKLFKQNGGYYFIDMNGDKVDLDENLDFVGGPSVTPSNRVSPSYCGGIANILHNAVTRNELSQNQIESIWRNSFETQCGK